MNEPGEPTTTLNRGRLPADQLRASRFSNRLIPALFRPALTHKITAGEPSPPRAAQTPPAFLVADDAQ